MSTFSVSVNYLFVTKREVEVTVICRKFKNENFCGFACSLCSVLAKVSLFPGFSTSRETENFPKISRECREIFRIPKFFGISEIFPSLIVLLFSGFQHF